MISLNAATQLHEYEPRKVPPSSRGSRNFWSFVPLLVVFLVGFGYPLIPTRSLFPYLRQLGLTNPEVSGVLTILRELGVTGLIVAIITRWERLKLSSVGLAHLKFSDLWWGIAAFFIVSVINELATPYILAMLPATASATIARQGEYLNELPHFLLYSGMLTGVILEELVARGYAIERLKSVTGSILLASAGALLFDVVSHIPYWGAWYPIVIAPSQLVFVLLYLERRTIWACVIAHFMMNSFPLPTQYLPPELACPIAPYTAGFEYYQRHDYDLAIAAFDSALHRNPSDAKAYDGRAWAEWKKNDSTRAILDFSEEIQLRPDSATGFANRARVYLASTDYARAETDVDHAIRLNPRSAYQYLLRSYIYSDQRRYLPALSDLDTAIHLKANDAEYFARRANIESSLKRYQAAFDDYSQAIRLAPQSSTYYLRRALASSALNNYDGALQDLAVASRLDHGDGKIPAIRIQIMVQAGSYREAMEEVDSDIARDPKNVRLRRLRAALALTLGDCADAESRFATLAKLVSSDEGTDSTAVWLAASCPSVGKSSKLLERGQRACEVRPGVEPATLEIRAQALARAGDFKRAVQCQGLAVSLISMEHASTRRVAEETLKLYHNQQYWHVERDDFEQVGKQLLSSDLASMPAVR